MDVMFLTSSALELPGGVDAAFCHRKDIDKALKLAQNSSHNNIYHKRQVKKAFTLWKVQISIMTYFSDAQYLKKLKE